MIPPDLMAAILKNPGDDAPRLASADWLDEHAGAVTCSRCEGTGWTTYRTWHGPASEDDEFSTSSGRCDTCRGTGSVPDGLADRAAYIRWAVARPQNSAVCLCGCRGRLPQPCETCRTMGAEVDGIPRRADGETHYVVNRGFVSEVRLTLADWQQHAPALLAAHPLERVEVADVPGLVWEVQGPEEVWPGGPTWVLVGRLSVPRRGESTGHVWSERWLSIGRAELVARAAEVIGLITARLEAAAGDRWPRAAGFRGGDFSDMPEIRRLLYGTADPFPLTNWLPPDHR